MKTALMGTSRLGHFRREGYVVLRGAFDPVPLTREFDQVVSDAFGDPPGWTTVSQGSGTVTFRYVPMMCERTPVSIEMIDSCSVIAAELLERRVVPGRAKGTWYRSDTDWHRDSVHDIPSVGVVAYLEPLTAATGALRVVPGSQTAADVPLPARSARAGHALETAPGDLIAFDEHIIHGSTGGAMRRQWRVDFLADPSDEQEHAAVSAWLDQSIVDEGHDPGYDTERYPSYGAFWRALDRPWINRLGELGVYRRAMGF